MAERPQPELKETETQWVEVEAKLNAETGRGDCVNACELGLRFLKFQENGFKDKSRFKRLYFILGFWKKGKIEYVESF